MAAEKGAVGAVVSIGAWLLVAYVAIKFLPAIFQDLGNGVRSLGVDLNQYEVPYQDVNGQYPWQTNYIVGGRYIPPSEPLSVSYVNPQAGLAINGNLGGIFNNIRQFWGDGN